MNAGQVRVADRIDAVKAYFGYSLLGHLGWEVLQLPLYTIFWYAPVVRTAIAVIHCTAGDMLIAAGTLALSCLAAGNKRWPASRPVYARVAAMTLLLGVGYAGFSEWLNTSVRHAWAYTPAMPVVPALQVGVAPLVQWVFVPSLAFSLMRRRTVVGERKKARHKTSGHDAVE